MKPAHVFFLVGLILCSGCGSEDASGPSGLSSPSSPGGTKSAATVPGATDADLFHLRNIGRLHAERDSDDGFTAALASFRSVVEQSPDTLGDRLNLLRALVFTPTEDPAAADEHLAAARRIAGEAVPADLEYLEGLVRKRKGDTPGSAAAFVRATAVGAEIVNVWFQQGHSQEMSGANEAAVKSYRHVLELNPDHRPSLYRLAMTLLKLERGDDAEKIMARFEALPEDKGDTEKCALTRVTLRIPDPGTEPAQPPLVLTDVTEKFLGSDSAGVRGIRSASLKGSDGIRRSGLLVLGESDLWFLVAGPTPLRSRAILNGIGPFSRAAVGDLDNDGLVELVITHARGIWVLQQQDDGSFGPASTGTWFDNNPDTRLSLFDLDHDGDLDAIGVTHIGAGPRIRVLRNNGDLTFSPVTPSPFAAIEPPDPAEFDAHDLDQGNDLDFVFPGADGVPVASLNQRDGTFLPVRLEAARGHTIVLVEDIDADGAPDLVATGGAPGVLVARNADRFGSRHQFRLTDVRRLVSDREAAGVSRAARLGDLDNDGDLDLVCARDSDVVVYRNVRRGEFEKAAVFPEGGTELELVDLDGDGRLEIAVITGSQSLRILSAGATPHAAWTLVPTGLKDNLDSVGMVLEQHAGPLYQSRMIKQQGEIHLGLGTADRSSLDGIRMRWPQGIVQPVIGEDLAMDDAGRVALRQKEGLVASCPFLYVRGPEGWRFVTDVVGIAPLGEWVPAGQTPHLDPEEFVRIPGSALESRDGVLSLAITEELRETTYLDRVELVAVDHPEDVELLLDESTRQGAYDPLRLWVIARDAIASPARVQVGATEKTERAATRDGVYLHPYAPSRSQWSGWVEPHAIELELPHPVRILLLEGRIGWYDSAVAFAVAQSGRGWSAPRLERLGDEAGILVDDVGLPAGLDRTLVVPFSKEPLPAGTRLRLTGQHRCLWDTIRFAADGTPVDIETDRGSRTVGSGTVGSGTVEDHRLSWQTLAVVRGNLEFHGYSPTEGNLAAHEQRYLYSGSVPDDPWPRARGRATRYGDVTPLLEQHDDRVVVLVAGDRVTLEIPAPSAAPGPGQARTYFLRVSGWAKESGYHVRTGETIAPLPYRGMKQYPPSAPRPMDDAYREYLEEYQTREVRY